jgi:hypothetical protein
MPNATGGKGVPKYVKEQGSEKNQGKLKTRSFFTSITHLIPE